MLWNSLHSAKPSFPLTAVDVRDVAAAHVKALELQLEGGEKGGVEEFILSAGVREGWTWENIARFVREKYPSVKVGLEGEFDEPPAVDTGKAEQVLGLKWRSMEDTVGAFLDLQRELGAQL